MSKKSIQDLQKEKNQAIRDGRWKDAAELRDLIWDKKGTGPGIRRNKK